MATEDEFATYSWETDDGWVNIEKRLDFGLMSEHKKSVKLKHRKMRYFLKHVNPDYEPGTTTPLPKGEEENTETGGEESKEEKASTTTEDEKAKDSEGSLANGTFVKLNLNNAKYNGLLGEIVEFLPAVQRYNVRLYLPETQPTVYKREIKVKADAITTTSKIPMYGELALHVLFLVFAFMSLWSGAYFSYALYISIILNFGSLFYLMGKPSMDARSAQQTMQNPLVMHGLISFALVFSGPAIYFLVPPLCRHINRGFALLSRTMKRGSPSLHSRLKPMIDPVLRRKSNFEDLSTQSEIYLGLWMIPGKFLGKSTLAGLFVYWSILRMKYMFSVPTQRAFSQVKQSVDRKISRFPMVLGYWQKICTFAYSYVDPVQMQQQRSSAAGGLGGMASSMMNKCTIM